MKWKFAFWVYQKQKQTWNKSLQSQFCVWVNQKRKKGNNNLKQKFTESVMYEATTGITPASQWVHRTGKESLRNVLPLLDKHLL